MLKEKISARIHPKVVEWMEGFIPVLQRKYPCVKSIAGVIEAIAKEQSGRQLSGIEPGKYERESNEVKWRGNVK